MYPIVARRRGGSLVVKIVQQVPSRCRGRASCYSDLLCGSRVGITELYEEVKNNACCQVKQESARGTSPAVLRARVLGLVVPTTVPGPARVVLPAAVCRSSRSFSCGDAKLLPQDRPRLADDLVDRLAQNV